MSLIRGTRPSPAMLVAVVALVGALAGTALAGSDVQSSALSKKKVKKIAKKEAEKAIDAAAPGLSVANADAVDGVSEEELTVGRSAFDGSCDPNTATLLDCVAVTLTLPRSGRVLLDADLGFFTDAGGAQGECLLEVDGGTTGIPHSTTGRLGEDADTTNSSATNGYARTAVTNVLAAGSHTFALSCNEDVANIVYNRALISAVMIGSA